MKSFVFILGAGRSGTKFLRDCLGAAEDTTAIPYDVGYIWRKGQEHVDHDELRMVYEPASTRRFIKDNLERMAEVRAGGRAYSTIIEKSVPNVLRANYVTSLFPEAKLVRIVRDGRDVIESAMRNWQTPAEHKYILEKLRYFPPQNYRYGVWYLANQIRSVGIPGFRKSAPKLWGPRYKGMDADSRSLSLTELCATQWNRCVEKCEDDLAAVPSTQVFRLRYEDLNSDGNVLADLCKFCEIDDICAVNKHFEENFRPPHGSSGYERLAMADREKIVTTACSGLRRFHYV